MIQFKQKFGFTLVEVVIGVGLFAMVMGMVLNSTLFIIKSAQIMSYKTDLNNAIDIMSNNLNREIINQNIDYQSYWYEHVNNQIPTINWDSTLNTTKSCQSNTNIINDYQFCDTTPPTDGTTTTCSTIYSYPAQFINQNLNQLNCQQDTNFDDNLSSGLFIDNNKSIIISNHQNLYLITPNGKKFTLITTKTFTDAGGNTNTGLFSANAYYGLINNNLSWYQYNNGIKEEIIAGTISTIPLNTPTVTNKQIVSLFNNASYTQISPDNINIKNITFTVNPLTDPYLAINSTDETIQSQPHVNISMKVELATYYKNIAQKNNSAATSINYQTTFTQVTNKPTLQKYPVLPLLLKP